MKKRYTLIGGIAGVAIVCIVMALLVSAKARRQKIDSVLAPRRLSATTDKIVSFIGLQRRVPASFAELKANSLVSEHFYIRPNTTMKDIAGGAPLVSVHPNSIWLLSSPDVVRALSELNAECQGICRELKSRPNPWQ